MVSGSRIQTEQLFGLVDRQEVRSKGMPRRGQSA